MNICKEENSILSCEIKMLSSKLIFQPVCDMSIARVTRCVRYALAKDTGR